MKLNVLSVVNSFILVGLVLYLVLFLSKDKTAYFYNQKVFEGFKGKIALEEKLLKEKLSNKQLLDSLGTLINTGRSDLKGLLEERSYEYQIREAELTRKYTEDIWKFINDSVVKYGKENNYDYIFGATGDGGLMYATESKDVTTEITEYVNAHYDGSIK